jgi:hypothetical protein
VDAHDLHFYYIPDSVGTVFQWGRPVPLVSVSSDGKELPKPYVYEDVLTESLGKITWKPSYVTHINDQDATQYLEQWAQGGFYQDRDALWNGLFYGLATLSTRSRYAGGLGWFAGSGIGRFFYPGAETKLTFANGTSRTYENYAELQVSFQHVTDGQVLYNFFFTENDFPTFPDEDTNSTSPTSSALPSHTGAATPKRTTSPSGLIGYPPAVMSSPDSNLGGYYLDGEHSDVAVLALSTFDKPERNVDSLSGPAAKFVADAKRAGKKKLIVDVSGNIGGLMFQAYNLFKILFPNNIDHAAGTRYVAIESTKLLTEIYTNASKDLPFTYDVNNQTLLDLLGNIITIPFDSLLHLDANSKPFKSWQDQYGPVKIKGAEFSNLIHFNLNSSVMPFISGGNYMYGYGPLSNYTEQPFATEDVVVVTDGGCTSSCHTFTDLIHQRAGVKLIALGGRPQAGMTQALGSVKGAQDLTWNEVRNMAQFAITNLTSPDESARINKTELGDYWDTTPFWRAATNYSGGINLRNAIRDGDKTETPLQFVYEEADCRILYTKPMTYDITAVWKAVADSTWGGKNHCIAGSVAVGGGGASSKIHKRQLSAAELTHSNMMADWRASLKVDDYPLDGVPESGS